MNENKDEKRATSVELSKNTKQYFGVKCEYDEKKKSPFMNELLTRFWKMNDKKRIIIGKSKEIEDGDRTLMGFELTLDNWAKLNQYVSEETTKGNKILKTDVLRFIIEKYLQDLGYFGNDI
jgi:hypothetical protein